MSIFRWIKENKHESLFLLVILLVAAGLRLWRIDEYLPFLGDEGRDVRVVYRFLTEGDLMFIGPRTSIGDMYLGPLFYYFISPFLLLFGFSPVGPAVAVALLGILTVGFSWFVGRAWFGKIAGVVAAALFATSPIVVTLSQHSWNPNIMPAFALLSVYSAWRVWSRQDYKWLLVLGVSFAFVLQSHYLGLLLVPTIGIFWLATWVKRENGKWKMENGKFLKYSLFAFSLFTLLMSPLVLFDAKHGWRNASAVFSFFAERQTTVSAKPWSAIPDIWPLWSKNVVTSLLAADISYFGGWIAVALAAFAVGSIVIWRKKLFPSMFSAEKPIAPFLLLITWIVIGLFGLGMYKQAIYAHYFEFMFPAVFLLLGMSLQAIWNGPARSLALVILPLMLALNLANSHLTNPPQRQMYRVMDINESILQESEGKPFNFALIAKRNYEEGYLYFFELWKAPVLAIDSQNYEKTRAAQLFVVCEDEECDPVHSSKAEVTSFGWSKVESEWETAGTKVFKLIQNPTGEPQ